MPDFDVPLNQEIIDQLTNNFEIKALKANIKNNIKKLSGIFAKPMMEARVPDNANFHSLSHSNSMVMNNANGEVNGIVLETINNVEHEPGNEVKRQDLFEFKKISPEGVITYGNMNHPIYMTPFGEFKPID